MNILAYALIPLSLLAVFFSCLAGTHFLSGFDFTGYWYPFLAHAGDWFHQEGTLPFWIPQIFCGIPLGESLGPAIYYPTEILSWVGHFSPPVFYLWDTVLHLLLAGGGAAVLARTLGMTPAGASVAGLAYMMGGILMVQVRVGIPVTIRCAALIPWVFILYGRWQAGRTIRPIAGISGLFGLMILTGGYQMLAYTLIALAVFSLFQPDRIRSLGTMAGMAIGAAALSAVTLLPNTRYYFHSLRSGNSMDFGGVAPLYFSDIPLLLIPGFNGASDPERIKYLGLIVLALALVGAAWKWRQMSSWLAVFFVAFILSLGNQTPIGQLVSGIPILGSFRVPMKWMLFGQLSVALLAGMAVSVLGKLRGKTGRILAVALPILVSADLLHWELRLRKISPVAHRQDILVEQYLPAYNGGFRIESVEPAPVINSRMQSRLEWITGYHTAPMARFVELYSGAASAGFLPAILPWMNTRFLVASESAQAGDRFNPQKKITGFDPVFGKDGRYILCEAADFAPRAWMAIGVVEVSSMGETLSLLNRYPPSSGLVAVNSYPDRPLPRRPGGGQVKFIRQSPNSVEIDASAQNAGLLVLADSFYPAWEARVDGKRVQILRANWIFRGVEVPAGRHRVAFKWNSIVFNIGLWLSLLAWSVLAGLVIRRNPS